MPTYYKTTFSELTDIASAIRSRTGNAVSMSFPIGFISEIGKLYGGQYSMEDVILKKVYSLSDDTMTSIPECYFALYSSATYISFPNCSYIGKSAFYSCWSIGAASFPNCEFISTNAFCNCYSLSSISFPACSYIGSYAFGSCNNLTTVYFSCCSCIEEGAFNLCAGLGEAILPSCSCVNDMTFMDCASLSSVSVPLAGYVGSYAFAYCSSLGSISLPNCTGIGEAAFYGCGALSSIYLLGSQVATIEWNTFEWTPITDSEILGYFGSVFVPSSLVSAYTSDYYWSDLSSRIVGI